VGDASACRSFVDADLAKPRRALLARRARTSAARPSRARPARPRALPIRPVRARPWSSERTRRGSFHLARNATGTSRFGSVSCASPLASPRRALARSAQGGCLRVI